MGEGLEKQGWSPVQGRKDTCEEEEEEGGGRGKERGKMGEGSRGRGR